MLDFKIIFDASPNAAMVLDRDLRFVAANPAYLRATGAASVEDLLGRRVFEEFPNDPDNPDNLSVRILRASFERVFRDNVVDHVPLIAYDVDGTGTRYWSATHTPLGGEDGRPAYVLQLTVDVTQLNEQERESSKAMISAKVLERAQDAAQQNTALNHERSRLLLLLEKAPAFVAVLRGKDHVFELVNEAYRKVLGHRDVIGRSVAEAVPEVVAQGFVTILDGVFTTGNRFEARGLHVELQHVPGGPMSSVVLDISYQAIVEADGTTSGIFVHGTDLTEQRELERHYEELSTVVSQSRKSMAIAGTDGMVTYINDAGRARHGVDDARLRAGIHARELIAAADRFKYDEVIVAAMARDGQWLGELDLVAADGGSYPAHHNAFLLRNKAGDVIGSASISRDLSAEKAAERERAELASREAQAQRLVDASERERRFLAESIPQQVWTAVPGTGHLDFLNQRVADYFGEPVVDLLGVGWVRFVHPDDKEKAVAAWQRSLESGAPYETTFRLRRHDGEWRWYLARAAAFRDDDGTIVKWFGTNTDIDDATRTNEELQRRTEFEQQLIGIVSHDLRNPLNAIALSAATLETPGGAGLDDRRRAAVGRITSSSNRAARMISDLLDFSQARSTGAIPVYPEKASLRALVVAVVDELQVAHPTRQVTIAHEGEELVVVDQDRIGQVIGNLVGNALQHSAADSVVTIRSRVDGDTAFIEVGNDGVIPVSDVPRLFEPFQQGTGAGAKTGRSVGLGLYIARQLVEAHAGTIEVSSTLERGTRFTVQLPRRPR